jgi:hypothetical protein
VKAGFTASHTALAADDWVYVAQPRIKNMNLQLFQSKALRKMFLAMAVEISPSGQFEIVDFITKPIKSRWLRQADGEDK